MQRSVVTIAVLALLIAGCAATPSATTQGLTVVTQSSAQRATQSPAAVTDLAELTRQAREAERGFAKTMADRDYAKFMTYLADETIFFTGSTPIRGKQAVADSWKRFYEKSDAPFSWEPEIVQVVDSGTLAISTGPVRDPGGKHFATFQSIWRQEAPGVWRIVFDKGERVCDCSKP